MEIKEILESNGYPVKEGPNYISTCAIFRGGDNRTAICIYPKDDLVIDFVTGEKYTIKVLIGKIFGIEESKKLDEFISENKILVVSENQLIGEKLISSKKKLDLSFLDKLKPIHDYWIDRGINKEILEELKGGEFNGRYHFPIFSSGAFVGLTSRDVTGQSKIKWIHKGKKTEWIWPYPKSVIEKQSVFLVESPGCSLSLKSVGIGNNLCCFGLDCSFTIVNFLLTIPNIDITISLNSDARGQEGAEKLYKRFRKYFDWNKVNIKLPINAKDWNDLLLMENGNNQIRKQLLSEK